MRFLLAGIIFAHILFVGTVSAADSLVAHWQLNEMAGDSAYDGAGSNTGLISGASWADDSVRTALGFDGNDDYVQVSGIPSITAAGAFTISVWVKPDLTAHDYNCVMGRNNTNRLLIDQYGRVLVQNGASGLAGNFWSAANGDVVSNEWTHIAYVSTGLQELLYINGTLSNTKSAMANGWDSAFKIGRYNDPYYQYCGSLDDIRMFNAALGAAEIAALYAEEEEDVEEEAAHPDTVYWSFDEGTGSLAASQDNADYPFEIFNASWNSEGISGSCLEFNYENGYGNYAEVRDTSFAACEERFSFSMWVYPYTSPSGSQKEHIFEKCYRSDDNTRGYQVALNYGQFHFSTSQPNGQWENGGGMAFGPTINAGQWYHLAFTWDKDEDSGALYGYVNGVRYHIYSKTTAQYVQNLPLLIGRYVEKPEQSAYCFNGRLDEIRYYGLVLDSNDVAALANEFPAPPVPLVFTDTALAAGVTGAGSDDSYGVSWGDYDGDGLVDLLVAGNGDNTRLYRNKGGFAFSDVTDSVGIDFTGLSSVFFDYDNDGDQDIYLVSIYEANQLWRNDGNGDFTETGSAAGITAGDGHGVVAADLDNDGHLDLYLGCNPHNSKTGSANVLYMNNGDGTFADATAASGTGDVRSAMGVSAGDINNDGYADLFVANNFNQQNILYLNDGDGTFSDVTDSAGLSASLDTKCGSFADYDDDGDADLLVTNQDSYDVLYRNNGDSTFTDVSSAAGIVGAGNSQGASFFDYNNDGDKDLYIIGYTGSDNVFYLNNGDGTFTDATDSVGLAGGGYSMACAVADADNDGYGDIFVVNAHGQANELYHNCGSGNAWIGILLAGTVNNADGIGAQIRLYAGGTVQYHNVGTVCGMYGQNGITAHFGLGDGDSVDSVTVVWPDGSVTAEYSPKVGIVHTLGEPADASGAELVLTHGSTTGDSGNIDISAVLSGPDDETGYRVNHFVYRFADSAVWNHIDPDSLTGNGLQQPGDVAFSWAAGSEVAPHAGESLFVSYRMASGFSTGDWGAITDKPTQRYELSAAVLDGKIYAAGGSNNNTSEKADMHIYDPGTGTWSEGAPLPEARRLAGSGVIDGTWFVVGGYYDGTMQSSLFKYDPHADSWSTGASMAEARHNPACGVIDGKLYAAGGALHGYEHSAVLEIYDPMTDSWSTGTPMPEERRSAGAAVWDGKLYVFGGHNGPQNENYLSSVVVYDPVADSWTDETDMPRAIGWHEVIEHEGLFYILGGYAPSVTAVMDSVYIFDPVRSDWRTSVSMQVPRSYFAACVLDDKIAAVGGFSNSNYLSSAETLAVFGRVSNHVIDGPVAVGVPEDASGAELVLTHGSTTGDSGNIYISSVLSGPDDETGYRVNHFAYRLGDSTVWNSIDADSLTGNEYQQPGDVAFSWGAGSELAAHAGESLLVQYRMGSAFGYGAWAAVSPIPAARYEAGAVTIDGKIYFAGGSSNNYSASNALYIYDPAADSWGTGAVIPAGVKGGAYGKINGKMYIAGGDDGGSTGDDVYEYDPVTDAWAVKALMPTSRCLGVFGVINNKLYVAGGGTVGYGHTAVLEIYDPVSDEWISGCSMPSERRNASGDVYNGELYVFGGNAGDMNDSIITNVMAYSPDTDAWRLVCEMPVGLKINQALCMGGRFFLTGGITENGSDARDSVLIYDPAADTWTAGPNMIDDRYYAAICGLANRIYVIGGRDGEQYLTGVETLSVDGLVSNVVTDGPLVIDENGSVPVELSSFIASSAPQGVVLSWTTESETDNLGWNVQRQTTAVPVFDRINGALIPGAGTIVIPQTYSYVDGAAAAGVSLYRLEQIDTDGTKSYSDEVAISIVALGIDIPQLVTGSPVRYGIRFCNYVAGNITITLHAANGEIVSVPADGFYGQGEHTAPLLETLDAGIYLVRIDAAGGSTTAKLVITR